MQCSVNGAALLSKLAQMQELLRCFHRGEILNHGNMSLLVFALGVPSGSFQKRDSWGRLQKQIYETKFR